MKENPLIGKRVISVFLAEDGGAIKFETDDDEIIARADGDCCSHSWIENAESPENLIGTVSAVENLKLNKTEDQDGDYIQFYGCKITTEKGSCTLDYRNESNGYYGGDLVWPGEHFYGGVYGQNISKEEWKKIA